MKPLLGLLVLLLPSTVLAAITADSFQHHFIARDMPGGNVGFGGSALADFDHDGDLDFLVVNRADRKVYWFEFVSRDQWTPHLVGELPLAQLGAVPLDVDGDGWIDLAVGGFWFRNPRTPREQPFPRYQYDSAIRTEIHDIIAADVDGDGRSDIIAMGDREGCFWYSIPAQPSQEADWPKTPITPDVLDDRIDIHSGFFPAGVGDLDKDGDADLFLADRWMENRRNGKEWIPHRVFFGRRGPWGFSARSIIVDLDSDGDNDIVATDSDGQNCGVAWLENNGRPSPSFTTHYLPNKAPGTRGSFHALRLADFDGDGDPDILAIEQEDPSILPTGATPRWFIFENLTAGGVVRFEERVLLDRQLGGHDTWVGDIDGDGDLDIVSKIWRVWPGNGNAGKVHLDWLENRQIQRN